MPDPSFLPLAATERLWGTNATSAAELVHNPRRVAVDLLRLFLANRTPVTLWGPVGARKTRTIEALGRERDNNDVPYQVITLQPSTQDPTIIHGMMYTSREGDKTVMQRSIPRVAEQVMRHAEEANGLTILFVDELTTCMPSQQNAMLGLLTHGKFEDADISKHISIVMAANPEGAVSSVIPLNEAVLNRGGHVAWFGDRKLFVDEWSTGFAGATTPPRESTVRLVNRMFDQDPDKVFRAVDNRWTPGTLVPWDMLEHTERAVTEMARMTELIEDVFADSPDYVTQHYIVEVCRALLGPHWADIAAVALAQRADNTSETSVISWVRAADPRELAKATDLDAVIAEAGSPWDPDLRHDQAAQVLTRLADRALDDKGTFSLDCYVGGWAFACAAPTEADRAGLSKALGRLATVGAKAMQDGLIDRTVAIPAFVPPEIRRIARDAATPAEAAAK